MALDVAALLGSVVLWRQGGRSLADFFVDAGTSDVTDQELIAEVRDAIIEAPEYLEVWQKYSYDKRWSHSPYLDGLEVGHYSAGKQHVRRHGTAPDACADFIRTEIRWVVGGEVVEAT